MADGDSSTQIMDKVDEVFEMYFNTYKGDGLKIGEGDNKGDDLPMHKAFSSDDEVSLPYIAIMCHEAKEHFPGLGVSNYDAAVDIEVRGHAEDTSREEQKRMAGVISHMLHKKKIVDLLNALDPGVDDFTALIWTPGDMSRFVEDNELVNKFEGILQCMPNEPS